MSAKHKVSKYISSPHSRAAHVAHACRWPFGAVEQQKWGRAEAPDARSATIETARTWSGASATPATQRLRAALAIAAATRRSLAMMQRAGGAAVTGKTRGILRETEDCRL